MTAPNPAASLGVRPANGRAPGAPLQAFLIVFLGAGIGGALRHGVNLLAARLLGTGFPFGTLIVNVVGSFAMGLIIAWLALRGQQAQAVRLFLTTGILGGFTTFSAFSLDTMLARRAWAGGGRNPLCRPLGRGLARGPLGRLLPDRPRALLTRFPVTSLLRSLRAFREIEA